MLRYVDGAKPGKKLRIETESQPTVSSNKKYEEKRVRKFLEECHIGRPWLKYENGKMFCECCRENETTGAFCVGTTNFKLTAIKQHENTNIHMKYAMKYLRPKTVEKSQAADCLMKLKKSEYDRLVIKFRTAHALAKSHQSFRFYNTMCRLDKAKDLDIGTSYLNDKSASTFVQTIADVTQDSVREKVLKSKYVSFTCDGSTDFTGDDMENVYVRVVVDGIVEDLFLNIGTANSAASAGIFKFLMETFDNLSLNIEEKMIGFCADGASNMQGTKTGLAALLKEKWPHIFITHCLAHRLELAFKDAIKKYAVYDRMTTLLLGIYYLYRKSPKQKKNFGRAFEALGMTVILPSRVGGTRWLPHLQRAISAFIKGFRAFVFQLETSSHENPKAEGLAKLARDGSVIIFILQLKMIIGVLARLSLYLQRRELCIGDAYMRVKAAKAELLQIFES
ncbi:zinc finger protein 862-like [Argopecten irradians]|uniref:zinc finger protein 862-like n=1 Tax=Argopecten irradians TaxID=31199 RepID=UPI00371F1AA3